MVRHLCVYKYNVFKVSWFHKILKMTAADNKISLFLHYQMLHGERDKCGIVKCSWHIININKCLSQFTFRSNVLHKDLFFSFKVLILLNVSRNTWNDFGTLASGSCRGFTVDAIVANICCMAQKQTHVLHRSSSDAYGWIKYKTSRKTNFCKIPVKMHEIVEMFLR